MLLHLCVCVLSHDPTAVGVLGAPLLPSLQALMTLVGAFIGWHKVAAALYAALALWLAWQVYRWVRGWHTSAVAADLRQLSSCTCHT